MHTRAYAALSDCSAFCSIEGVPIGAAKLVVSLELTVHVPDIKLPFLLMTAAVIDESIGFEA